MAVNKIILLGNLGVDPELKYMDDGTAKATFTLATNEKYTNRAGERITETQWHRIVCWRSVAETAQRFLKKGDQTYLEGKLTHRSYDDGKGETKYITEIVASRIYPFLNGRNAGNTEQNESGLSMSRKSDIVSPLDREDKKVEDTPVANSSASVDKGEDELPF